MSVHNIRKFLSDIEAIKKRGGTSKETAIRTAFQYLLNEYAREEKLMLIREFPVKDDSGNTITPDGTLKDFLQLDWGYWISSNEKLKPTKNKKFRGRNIRDITLFENENNILYEDGTTAVLTQRGIEVCRCPIKDEANLDRLLRAFVIFKSYVEYKRTEVKEEGELTQPVDLKLAQSSINFLCSMPKEKNPYYDKVLARLNLLTNKLPRQAPIDNKLKPPEKK